MEKSREEWEARESWRWGVFQGHEGAPPGEEHFRHRDEEVQKPRGKACLRNSKEASLPGAE